MRTGRFVVSLVLSVAAPALVWASYEPSAWGQLPPRPLWAGDTVLLKNGGMIRGTLIEVLPGDHVTIALPDGSMARIAWPDVERIESRPIEPPPVAPSLPAAPPPLAPATMPMSGPTVWVHVATPRPVILDRQDPATEQWVIACESPCDVALPLNNHYRIAGSGIHASSTFDLEGKPGERVTITVHPGSRAALIGGGVAAGLGAFGFTPGIYLTVIGAAISEEPTGKAILTAGLITLAASVTLGIVGGIIAYKNWKTDVTQD
jgi:hypothetical protein